MEVIVQEPYCSGIKNVSEFICAALQDPVSPAKRARVEEGLARVG